MSQTDSNAPASSMWFINQDGVKQLTRFDSVSFFYQSNTSETHLLTAFHDELVDYLLDNEKASTQQLSHYIAQICEEKHSAEWLEKTNRALSDLAAISLIEKRASE